MNFPLYKQMMKVNLKGIMNYAIGSAFYMILMVWIYPSMAENSKAINDMIKAMPQGMLNAVGMQSGFGSFESFISGEYYGVVFVLIVSIFCVMVTTQLMAKLVDQGSMAYLLASPTTRGKVAFTQTLVFITGLLLIMIITTLSGLIGFKLFIEDENSFHIEKFLQLNVGALLLFFAIGGITFLVSALSNDEKKALGISGTITFGFFSLDLIGKISEKIDWLRNFTLFSLYRPGEIVEGKVDLLQVSIILFGIGAIAFIIGIFAFRKRDLPL